MRSLGHGEYPIPNLRPIKASHILQTEGAASPCFYREVGVDDCRDRNFSIVKSGIFHYRGQHDRFSLPPFSCFFRHGPCFCKQGSLTNKINDTDIIDSADEKAAEHFDNLFKNKEFNFKQLKAFFCSNLFLLQSASKNNHFL